MTSVVATAGHVDHGKSTLVMALTGTDPDRFREEKERGLTIDLGFAWTTLADGRQLAFVDVPGHVRFIRNMLAGVGAVEACLFVVAANEGWKPQSEEHLRILEILGIDRGVVALTKVGLVDPDLADLTELEVGDHLAGSSLEGWPLLRVDALAGLGLGELRSALAEMAGSTAAADRSRPRLWIDRSFSVRGAGTVVTGTLTGGGLSVGDTLELVPTGTRVRVRGLQSHRLPQDRVGPGQRVAVNLSGIGPEGVSRGRALVAPAQWLPTRRIDASLQVLPGLDHPVGRRGAYQLYVGSAEQPTRLRVLGAESIGAGATGLVRLHMSEALALLPGDRYVLREAGRAETIGGGEVLDIDPVLPAARARPSRSVERVVAERGWVEVGVLERLTGVRLAPEVAGRWVVSPAGRSAVLHEVLGRLDRAGPHGLDPAVLDERARALAQDSEELASVHGRIHRRGRRVPGQPTTPTAGDDAHPWLQAIAAEPFHPPAPDGVDRVLLRRWVLEGKVVEAAGIYFSADAVEEAARRVARCLAVRPGGVTASEVREALGTSRKYALPLLGHFDATGVTRRRGEVRLGGPRLPVG